MSRPATAARRWPDLLIGLLVALLLLGFGVLLFRPQGRPATTAPVSATPESTIPAAPGGNPAAAPTVPGATAPEAGTPGAATPDASAPLPGNAPTDDAGTTSPTEPPTIAASPVAPVENAATTAPTPETSPAAETAAGTTPAGDSAATAPPRSGGAVPTSEQRVPLRSDYRITLGTFSTAQAASSAAAPVSALGYTVYPIDLGSQVVAQVGPFADETSARQALADIQRAYPRALLYPPRNRSLSQGSATSSGTASTDSAGSGSAATASAPAPSGPTYLQVGAFNSVDSAQRLVQQLRDLGYSPSVNAPAGKKVTVLVGPFTGDALVRAESRLSASGLDHFRVR